ncbi:hypothetical protein [Nostoc sp.]
MKQVSKALNERITGDWGLVFLLSPQHGLNSPSTFKSGGRQRSIS